MPVGVANDRTLGEPPPDIGLEYERQVLIEPTASAESRDAASDANHSAESRDATLDPANHSAESRDATSDPANDSAESRDSASGSANHSAESRDAASQGAGVWVLERARAVLEEGQLARRGPL